jgi:hypothetical protein
MSEQHGAIYLLEQVFVRYSDIIPWVTYVEPDNAILLKLALEQSARVVIVEGPAQTGKTVTLKQLTDSSGIHGQNSGIHIQKFLDASKRKDLQDIQTLQVWHTETVVIDSFNYLDLSLRQELADYLTELVTEIETEKKLVIIGTPLVHQSLIDVPPQFVTNVEFFRFEHTEDRSIWQLIEKGEHALNVRFESKEEIVQAAKGSLNLAQWLCYNLCGLANATQTQKQTKNIPLNMKNAIKQIMDTLNHLFTETIKYFIKLGDAEDTTCLRILIRLASTEDGILALSSFKANEPSLAYEINRFVHDCWMEKFYERHPEAMKYLFFERTSQTLFIDDPRFSFYLRNRDLSALAQEVGKTPTRPKVFISYCHSDADCLERLMVFLKPIERQLIIESWSDKKIEGGHFWREEIEKALNAAKAAILLISADFWASDYIMAYELPKLLANAKDRGTKILPVILSPSDFDHTAVKEFQSINPPNQPMRKMDSADQDATFVKLTNLLREHFHMA